MTIYHPKKPKRESVPATPGTDSFSEWYKDAIPIVTRDQARGAARTVIAGTANDTDALAIIRALGIAELAR